MCVRAVCTVRSLCTSFKATRSAGRTGTLPDGRTGVLQRHESMTIVTLPADNGTWSVTLVTSRRDPAMRDLRRRAHQPRHRPRLPVAAIACGHHRRGPRRTRNGREDHPTRRPRPQLPLPGPARRELLAAIGT